MARLITTGQDYALMDLLRESDEDLLPIEHPDDPDYLAARERVLTRIRSIHTKGLRSPYEDDHRTEQVLHAAMYDGLQGAVQGAERAINDCRELCYLLTQYLPDTSDAADSKATVEINAWHIDTIRDYARRWLDSNGRNTLKEAVMEKHNAASAA